MKIGYDAKRLFTNFTGLGNYSRSVISHYHHAYPEDELHLFTPSVKKDPRTLPFLEDDSLRIISPQRFRPLWRTFDMVSDIKKSGVEIYHGLSHELPIGLSKLNIGKVVTIHDLIFKYYPHDHGWIDRKVYDWKWKHACGIADVIIAISMQTKNDLIQFYNIPPDKIKVVYQPADPVFAKPVSAEQVNLIKAKYRLPDRYNLYVGSVISRKNLLAVIKAMAIINKEDRAPLVIIGHGKAYKKKVIENAQAEKTDHLLFWLDSPAFADFPAIYKGAQMMIYPSLYEGFGLPVIEAMHTGIPVITSGQSSLKEAGGEAAVLVDPSSPEDIAVNMIRVQNDAQLRTDMIQKGFIHIRKLQSPDSVSAYHDIYSSLL